jgi:tetratricopeptide (TPR) repeat protein
MIRFNSTTYKLFLQGIIVVAFLMALRNIVAQNGAGQSSAIIQGTVTDPSNALVSDATVKLEREGSAKLTEMKTTSTGAFVFSAVAEGSYLLRAEKPGLGSISVAVAVSRRGEQKKIELKFQHAGAASSAAQPAMEFEDKPNFTVAGVTDWTAVGGHGSDAILRTSETLARETLTLKPIGEGVEPAGSAETIKFSSLDSEYKLALASKHAGDLKQAREHVEKSLARKESPDAHRLAGELDEQMGDSLAAVHEFEQAARLDASEQNYFEWGSELLLHRAVWQAREVFGKGVEVYPKSIRLMTALGAALFAGARYDEAALRLCDASDLNPTNPEPYAFIGKIELVAPTPLPCVEQKLARFAQLQPDNSLANYLYAMAIWKRQSQSVDPQASEQVQALLTKSVTIDPKCADALLQLGIMATADHNFEQATNYYLKAIEANPRLGEAHYRLGVTYDRAGEAAKAKREFQLHDEIEKQQADEIESQRREVKQFLIVLQGQPSVPPAP